MLVAISACVPMQDTALEAKGNLDCPSLYYSSVHPVLDSASRWPTSFNTRRHMLVLQSLPSYYYVNRQSR